MRAHTSPCCFVTVSCVPLLEAQPTLTSQIRYLLLSVSSIFPVAEQELKHVKQIIPRS